MPDIALRSMPVNDVRLGNVDQKPFDVTMLSAVGSDPRMICRLFTPVVAAAGIIYYATLRRWTGAAWVKATMKRWTGGAWVDAVLKVWTGTDWGLIDTTG